MISPVACCDYCALPLPGWAGRAPRCGGVAPVPQYCCFGCRFAAAVTRERGAAGAAHLKLVQLGLSIFCTMNVLAFTMALWGEGVYGDPAATPAAQALADLFRYLGLLFSLPVLFFLGRPLVVDAWQTLRHGGLTTDLLLVCGVAAAFIFSTISAIRGAGDVYFEVGCVILVMVTLGRWLEATGRLKAGAHLDELQQLLPERVRRIRGGVEESVLRTALVPGDRVRVLPGERIPIDGRLQGNSTWVDECVVTGESWPVARTPGDPLLGGSLNLDGEIVVEAVLGPAEAALARLVDAVRRARLAKGRHQLLADRIAAAFFPVILTAAAAAGGFHAWRSGPAAGILAGLAVVLISCPCALGVAVPLAVWTALGRAARRQVLFRSGEALERLAEIRVICFDKTGTLTTGTAQVVGFDCEPGDDPALTLAWARDLARGSLHPLSRAILAEAERRPLSNPATPLVEAVHCRPGLGVVGRQRAGGQTVALGSQALMDHAGLTGTPRLAAAARAAVDAGCPVALIGWQGQIRGLFTFQEELRASARETIAWFRQRGIEVLALTGDQAPRAAKLAAELGIPVRSGLLPEDKAAAVQELSQRVGPVAMVGDGVNDAPALAASHVGVAVGCGTDLARESAGVCLMNNDLLRLCWSTDFARRTMRTVRRNLYFAFAYNVVGVALAASGRLNPATAALLMVASSLLVIRSALQVGDEPAAAETRRQPMIAPG